jgi:hypothetical protein
MAVLLASQQLSAIARQCPRVYLDLFALCISDVPASHPDSNRRNVYMKKEIIKVSGRSVDIELL